MGNWISSWIDQLGYIGIAVLMFLENVFPPIPSELIMPLSGYVAQQGKMNIWGVIVAGTIGSCVGQIPLYYFGRFLGTERLKCWLDRFPWLAVSPSELDKANCWFAKHGCSAVFFCRLVPGIRSLISIPAGICGMSFPRLLIYTSCGTLIWTASLAWAGWFLGERNNLVERYLHPISVGIIGIIFVLYVVRVVKRIYTLRHRRRGSPGKRATTPKC